MRIIYFNKETMDVEHYNYEYERLMNMMCVCGHPLRHHAFTSHNIDGKMSLWVSQCVFCKNNVENNVFLCGEFTPK